MKNSLVEAVAYGKALPAKSDKEEDTADELHGESVGEHCF